MSRSAKAIIQGLKKKGMSQTELAKSMGEDVRSINQQLNRQKDMKVERFVDVMEHIGYSVELEERDFRRVSPQFGKQILETCKPEGLFYYEEEPGLFVGIDTTEAKISVEEFSDFDALARWFSSEPCVNTE
jgi:lambda repressor-like predicted transcriptional regulator